MKPKEYDIIVIGGGGGTKLARPATELGFKAAIIEKDALGGTCLNRGCIPSKMLIHPADVRRSMMDAEKFFIHGTKPGKVNFAALTGWITSEVSGDSKGIEIAYEKNNLLDYYHGEAQFIDNHTIAVNGKKITAPKIVIAAGARPRIPDIPGLVGTPFMTSTEALRNSIQPERMIVIGGGYIGVELGHAYGALGTEIELITRGTMLAREDHDVSEEFERVFSDMYTVRSRRDIVSVTHDGKHFHVISKCISSGKEQTHTADALLVAAGVVSNCDTLALQNTDITVSNRGFIEVDEYLQTSVDGIYAIGDIVGNYMFRHSVNFEGEYLFDQLFGTEEDPQPIDYPPMPHAVFSYPQIGSVGKTEEELQKEKTPYIVGKNNYEQSAMGTALRSDHGFVKLLFHKHTHTLLGAHIVGDEASNMIHMLIAFMNMGATLEDLLRTIYIHPALPEIIRNAARNARKQ